MLTLSSQQALAVEGGYAATDISQAPWHTNFIVAEGFWGEGRSFCGGAVLGDRWVLTAASCFSVGSITEESGFKIVVGSINQSGAGGVVIESAQTSVHLHPLFEYFYAPGSPLPHDAALVELASPISCIDGIDNDGDGDTDGADADCLTGSEGDGVPVIPLALDQTASWPETGATVQMMGYSGSTASGIDENYAVLQLAYASVIGDPPPTDYINSSCDEVYADGNPSYSNRRNFCAGGNLDSPIGHGSDDVGGPLVAELDGVQVLAGIASMGYQVGAGFSNFTRLTSVLHFIGSTAPELLQGRPAPPSLSIESQARGTVTLNITPSSDSSSPPHSEYTTTCELQGQGVDSASRFRRLTGGAFQHSLGAPLVDAGARVDDADQANEEGALVYGPSPTLGTARAGETLRFVDPKGNPHLLDIVTAQTLPSGNRLIRAEREDKSVLAVVTNSGDFTATVRLGDEMFQASILDGETLLFRVNEQESHDAIQGGSDIIPGPSTPNGRSANQRMKADNVCGTPTRTAIIKIGVVYDDGVAFSMDPVAEIELLIAETNLIYRTSGVDIRFESVEPLHYQPEDTSFFNTSAYQASEEVDAWRRRVKPDLIHILKKDGTEESGGICGFASLPWYDGAQGLRFNPWGTTKLGQTSSYGYFRDCPTTFAHEVGHNLGLVHDIVTELTFAGSGTRGVFSSYGRGHSWDIYDILGYPQTYAGTLMSYAGSRKTSLLSNPALAVEGVPTGVPAGQRYEANAALAIQDIMCYAERIADNGPIEFHPLFTRQDGNGVISTPSLVQSGNDALVAATPDPGYEVAFSGCGGSQDGEEYRTDALLNACAVRAQFYAQPVQTSNDTTVTFELPEGFEFSCTSVATNAVGDSPQSYAQQVLMPSIERVTILSTVNGEGGSVSPTQAVLADVDEALPFDLIPEAGFAVANVAGSCEGETLGNKFIAVPSRTNCEFIVTFDVARQVSPVVAEGGTVTPATAQVVATGGSVQFQVIPEVGFRTKSSVTGNCPEGEWLDDVYTVSAVNDDCSVGFDFESDPVSWYEVSTVVNGSEGLEVISPESGVVAHKDFFGLHVGMLEGYDVKDVGGNCAPGKFEETRTMQPWSAYYDPIYLDSPYRRYTTGKVTADCTVEINIGTPPFYIVTSSAGEGGTISPVGDHLVDGDEELDFILTPQSGFAVSDIGGDCPYGVLEANEYRTAPINISCSVIALFELLPPTEPPETPTILSIEAGDERITIIVSASAGAATYRATCSGADGIFKGESDNTTIVVEGVSNGETYSCTVAAENIVDISDPSVPASVTVELVPSGLPVWLLYEATK